MALARAKKASKAQIGVATWPEGWPTMIFSNRAKSLALSIVYRSALDFVGESSRFLSLAGGPTSRAGDRDHRGDRGDYDERIWIWGR